MKDPVYVVQQPANDLYLTGYNQANPPASIFGNLENAVEFRTLEESQETAALIGGGTVGTTKPS